MHHVLIIDDSSFVLNVVEKALHKEIPELTVHKAKSLFEANELLKVNNYHAAIIDINLPDSRQGEAIDAVTSKNIPAIILTANIDESIREIVLKKNIVEFVAKSDPNNISYVAFITKRILNNYDTTVLVVDDFKSSRSFIVKQLQKLHLNVLEASSALEAIELLNNHENTISMVLTDYDMPDMDGLEFTFYLRQHYRKDVLSVIAISAIEGQGLSTQFLKYGANDFLHKPFTIEELTVRINSNLELLEMFNEKKELASRDFLSGLYNRRYFIEHGHLIIKKMARYEFPVAVAIIDIDHFKRINDIHGHDIGDIAIQATANMLEECLRKSDLLARYGGEEFCMMMENLTREQVEHVTEKIRDQFESFHLKLPAETLTFTVSIGVYYGKSGSLESMIKIADEALYTAKKTGRNKVVIISPDL
jgi:diguanylate cyclase (GGDEF)-like protein